MTDPVHRTNINIYQSDYEYLLTKYGYGWTAQVRDLIHEAIGRMQEDHGWPRVSIPIEEWSKLNAEPPIDLEALIKEHNGE